MMLSVIIPTYNERESILDTIKKVQQQLPKTHEILVIDDDSPDGTAATIKRLTDKRVRCIIRKGQKGLSSAILHGFSQAKGDLFLVTDADGQHDPSIIPQMIKAAKEHDIVIASRFTAGGSVEGWDRKRILLSRIGAMMADWFIPYKLTDPLSGYFLINKKKLPAKQLDAKGFKILFDILLSSGTYKVTEIGYHFRSREKGASKLSTSVLSAHVFTMLRQIIRGNKTLAKFLVVGASGVVVNTAALYLLTQEGLHYRIASPIAIEAAILSNFFLNNAWTWRHRNTKYAFGSRIAQFHSVALLAMIINYGVLLFFTEVVGLHYLLSNLVGIALGTIINFWVNNIWTFKE